MKVIDMHCDTISRLLNLRVEGKEETLRENTGHLDLLRMKQGEYLLQNFALFVELDRDGDPWERVRRLYELYREELGRRKAVCHADSGGGSCLRRRHEKAEAALRYGGADANADLEFS